MLHAAAWATPVVALAAAAPSASASTPPLLPPTTLSHWGSKDRTPITSTAWYPMILTIANFESPITTAPLVMTLTPTDDIEIQYDPSSMSFEFQELSGGAPPFVQAVDNPLWTLTSTGSTTTFTSAMVLEPGWSQALPNQSTIGFRIRAVPGAASGTRALDYYVNDAVTTIGVPVPFGITFA